MNDIVQYQGGGMAIATAEQIHAQVQRVQQVMKAVMKRDVHYGIVPGTKKPSLWKPGAEVLCATFHIAPEYRIEDLSTDDYIRYRITCIGIHQGSGTKMGEGLGECSSNEEKYKWERVYNKREYEALPADRRRIKFGWDKDKRAEYEIFQARVDPADNANTVLKMAQKRAQIGMTLSVTAASDIFSQGLEDLRPGQIHGVDPDESGDGNGAGKPREPQSKSGKTAAPADTGNVTDGELKWLEGKLSADETMRAELNTRFHMQAFTADLTKAQFKDIKSFLVDPAKWDAEHKAETADAAA